MTDRVRSLLPRAGGHAILIGLSVFSLFPIAWMYVTALRPSDEALDQSLLPGSLSLDNLQRASQGLRLGELALNTTAMAALVTAGQLLTSLLAAYAFTQWRFRGQRVLFVAFVATWLVPFQVTMIPNYVLLSDLGLLGTLAGVVVPQLSAAFAAMMLRQHLRSFPKELIDAARMDGLSSWSILWRVVVPNLRAPLAALTILLFITAWNEFFWPLLVFKNPNSVIQIGLQSFLTDAGNDYGALMAAAGLLSLPLFGLYLLMRRHVIDAFVRSGLK